MWLCLRCGQRYDTQTNICSYCDGRVIEVTGQAREKLQKKNQAVQHTCQECQSALDEFEQQHFISWCLSCLLAKEWELEAECPRCGAKETLSGKTQALIRRAGIPYHEKHRYEAVAAFLRRTEQESFTARCEACGPDDGPPVECPQCGTGPLGPDLCHLCPTCGTFICNECGTCGCDVELAS